MDWIAANVPNVVALLFVVIVVGIAYCLWLKNKKTPAVNVPAGKKA